MFMLGLVLQINETQAIYEKRSRWPRFLCVIMESPGRTNDDETSPPDLVDDVDLELGVCPACLVVAGLVQLLPRFRACLYFTEVPK
jgi:hypothetical protein